MNFKNPKIEKIYNHFSKISREAYKDPFLISNIIFSKQESSGGFLDSYLKQKKPVIVTPIFASKKLSLYLIKNILGLLLTIITAIFHRLSGQKWLVENKTEIIILDTFFVISNILNKKEIEDKYFPGLSEHLIKRKKTYAIIPRLFGSKNPFVLFRVFRILKKQKSPAITHYQILRFVDYLKALQFIIFYPFSIFRIMKKLGTNVEDRLILFALWENLDSLVLENYIRFLFGKRLSFCVSGKIKCISWFENVSADKNFYLGLRTRPENIEIIGAQFFVKPQTPMNIVPDENEIPFKVVPDKILVNGPGYRFGSDLMTIDIGPSLRYRHLFNSETIDIKPDFALVVMPYWDHVISYILDVIKRVDWTLPIKIKFHPTTDLEKYITGIPQNFSVTSEPLPVLLSKTSIAIGHSTGALIEAISLGIPAIDIQYSKKFSHDYMPEIGKGVLWDTANDAKEVGILIKKFLLAMQENPESLKEEGKKIRSFCFSEPTEKLINTAFGLD